MNSTIYTTIKNSGKVNNKKTFIQLFLSKACFLCYFTLLSTSENVTHLS